MTDKEAKDKVTEAFTRISQARTISDLESLPDKLNIPIKNRFNLDHYPAINFNISVSEITELKKLGLISENNTFSADLSLQGLHPIAKLLYCIAWKNGDLQKAKHIVEGILDCQNPTDDREDGLVFHQFGKFLSGTPHEPIIDQHVLRAFAIYQANTPEQVKIARKLSTISKRNNDLIKNYKFWVKNGPELQESLRSTVGYTYHLDKLLFAVGKTVKLSKRTSKSISELV